MFNILRRTAEITLGTAVANAGTVTVAYPAGTDQDTFTAPLASMTGSVAINNNDVFPQAASGAGTIALTYGESNITVTNNTGAAWPVGSKLIIGLEALLPGQLAGLDSRVDALENA